MEGWNVLDLAGDPIPGDPAQIRALVARLKREAEHAEQHTNRLHQVVANSGDLRMHGDYAPKFLRRLTELPDKAARLGPAHQNCGNALAAYAEILEQAKIQSRIALSRGLQADAQYKAALQQFYSLVPVTHSGSGLWRGLNGTTAGQLSQYQPPEIRQMAVQIGAYAGKAEQERQTAVQMARAAVRVASEAEAACAQAIRAAALMIRRAVSSRSAVAETVEAGGDTASNAKAGSHVGALRFKEGGGGVTVLGEPYKTPKTPGLAASVNPGGGRLNCRACALAVDQRLAGGGITVAPPQIVRGSLGPIEQVYGREFRDRNFTWIVRTMKKAGDGARGIVYGSDKDGGHVFNVVNQGGEVIFIDGQVGHAKHAAEWDSYKLLRTN